MFACVVQDQLRGVVRGPDLEEGGVIQGLEMKGEIKKTMLCRKKMRSCREVDRV